MANYMHLKIVDVTETKDRETGEIRIRAECIQVDPEKVNLNLSRKTADIISKMRSLKGKSAMVPVKHGVFNDRPFTSFDDGTIIPTSN